MISWIALLKNNTSAELMRKNDLGSKVRFSRTYVVTLRTTKQYCAITALLPPPLVTG